MPFTEHTCTLIQQRLGRLYGEQAAAPIAKDIETLCRAHLKALGQRPAARQWDQKDAVLITYGGSIQRPGEPPLKTLKAFADQRLQGAINCIHILPFFPYSSDDGFSVIDFREVDEELGDWDDIHAIGEHFDLMVDLVLNHVSRRSLWFNDYLADIAPYNRFFVEADPSDPLSQVVRPRSTPLLWKVRTRRGNRYVWGTFSSDQIDLDYRNSAVLIEMLDILLFYLRAGSRIVRLDAVAFLWKEIGTSCIHLPQTHEVVKLFRDIMSAVAPDSILLTETNVPNAENRSYFGTTIEDQSGQKTGDEAQMIYQFSLPPLLLHALHSGYTAYLHDWAQTLDKDPAPPGCTYLNFTASHDGVGLRGLEGLVPDDEIKNLLHAMHARGGYVSMRRMADGREKPYELNISYFEAFRDPSVEHDPWHIPCFLLSQYIALSLRGIPALYIHSFTATPNDHHGVEVTGRTRTINRRQWDFGELNALLDDAHSEQAIVFKALSHALQVRAQHPAFSPDAHQQVLDLKNPHLFALLRNEDKGQDPVLCVFNFTPDPRQIAIDDLCPNQQNCASSHWQDLISGEHPQIERGRLKLPGYAAYWLASNTDA